MSTSNSQPGDDIKAKWSLLFNYVLADGADNCQRAFDMLCDMGHAKLGAAAPQGDLSVSHITPGAAAQVHAPLEESKDTRIDSELVDPMNLNKCAHCKKRGVLLRHVCL